MQIILPLNVRSYGQDCCRLGATSGRSGTPTVSPGSTRWATFAFTWQELRRGQEYCLAVLPVGGDGYLAVRSNGQVDSAYTIRPGEPDGR